MNKKRILLLLTFLQLATNFLSTKPVGLDNPMMLCYHNATMQCVTRLKPLTELLMNNNSIVGSVEGGVKVKDLYKAGSIGALYRVFLNTIRTTALTTYLPEQPFTKKIVEKFFFGSIETMRAYQRTQQDASQLIQRFFDQLFESQLIDEVRAAVVDYIKTELNKVEDLTEAEDPGKTFLQKIDDTLKFSTWSSLDEIYRIIKTRAIEYGESATNSLIWSALFKDKLTPEQTALTTIPAGIEKVKIEEILKKKGYTPFPTTQKRYLQALFTPTGNTPHDRGAGVQSLSVNLSKEDLAEIKRLKLVALDSMKSKVPTDLWYVHKKDKSLQLIPFAESLDLETIDIVAKYVSVINHLKNIIEGSLRGIHWHDEHNSNEISEPFTLLKAETDYTNLNDSLEKSLDRTFGTITIEDDSDEKFFCIDCGKYKTIQKQLLLQRLPQVLSVQINRFRLTQDGSGNIEKVFHAIPFPMVLHVKPDWLTDDFEGVAAPYQLVGIIVHSGSMTIGPTAKSSSGHYYAYAKEPDEARKWMCYDDRSTTPQTLQQIKDLADEKGIKRTAAEVTTVRSTPYILFYEQMNTADALAEAQLIRIQKNLRLQARAIAQLKDKLVEIRGQLEDLKGEVVDVQKAAAAA